MFVVIEACVEVTHTGDFSLSYNTILNDDSFCKSCGTPKVRTLVSGLIVLSQDNCNAKETGKTRKCGYGKYNFNMVDADLIQSRKDNLQKWLKACRLKTTGRKQEPFNRVLKCKAKWHQNNCRKRNQRERRARGRELLKNFKLPKRAFRIQRR